MSFRTPPTKADVAATGGLAVLNCRLRTTTRVDDQNISELLDKTPVAKYLNVILRTSEHYQKQMGVP